MLALRKIYDTNNGLTAARNVPPALTTTKLRIVMADEIVHKKSKFPRGVPESIQKEMIELYLKGLSTYKVGERFGVSDACVSSALKRSDIPRRSKALKRDAEIIPLYLSGIDAPQIEEQLGVSCSHVYDVLRRNSIKRRDNVSRIERHLSAEQKAEIISLYGQNMPAPVIAERMNLSSWGVWRFLKKSGVKLRRQGSQTGEWSSGWKGGLTNDKEYQKKKSNLYNKQKRDTDPLFKMGMALRNQINSALKKNGYKKNSRTYYLLGTDFLSIKKHIEDQFTDGMTWSNHGKGYDKWNYDHSIPLATAQTEEELIKLFHFSNLKPMWWIDNISKGSLHNGKRYYKRRIK